MWNIFNRKRQYNDLRWMHVDIHSHVLPGLDDGSPDMPTTALLLESLQELGIYGFYPTPHIFQEMYPNSPSNIGEVYAHVERAFPDSILRGFAAEYMLDAAFNQLLEQPVPNLLTLPGGYILIEMSYMQENTLVEKHIFDLQVMGYKPILAHPERYIFCHHDPQRIKRFRDIGCLLQLNLLSLFGHYGPRERRVALYLLDKGWIDLVGTDVHHERHVKALVKGTQKEDPWPYFKKCHIQNQALFGID